MIALRRTPAWANASARLRGVLNGAVSRRLFLDRKIDFWLGELTGLHSFKERRARVVRIVHETHDIKTFVLDPGSDALGAEYRAGQYLPVDVEINGVRVRRCYSLSSAPGSRLVAITVKRVPGGKVSTFLHDHVRVGTIVGVGEPSGAFVLPEPTPTKLLLVGGGSGVTPLMSILRDLHGRSLMSDVVFVQCARSSADVAFARELLAMAARHPCLKVVLRLDDANNGGHLDLATLREIVPDFDERETFLCGPPGMMSVVTKIYDAVGSTHRLRIEQFVAARRVEIGNDNRAEGSVSLRLSGSGRTVVVGPGTLLEELERAGERPVFGCRMGICQTCRCRKRSGTVMDLNTGRVSNEPDEDIRLCVSVAQSDLDLAL